MSGWREIIVCPQTLHTCGSVCRANRSPLLYHMLTPEIFPRQPQNYFKPGYHMIYKIIFTFLWNVRTSSEELLMSHSIYVYIALSHLNVCFRALQIVAAPHILFPIRNHCPVHQILLSLRVGPILHPKYRNWKSFHLYIQVLYPTRTFIGN